MSKLNWMKNVWIGSISFSVITFISFFIISQSSLQAQEPTFKLEIKQLTFGDKHHFFGYIGQCRTLPWNGNGRYILGLEIERIDRMPKPEEAAKIFVIDSEDENKIIYLDKTNGWNPQQGTMFFWNPNSPNTEFFFNDRDTKTGEVFTVLYDMEKRERIKEYRYDDTHIGNGGVAWDGSFFMGLNYGRLARLRRVTGYPNSLDWSKDELAPENDGIFKVDIKSGEKELLVSYRQMEDEIKKRDENFEHTGLFVNHTLLNRDGTTLYFFARAGWQKGSKKRTNIPFSINLDGSNLKRHEQHIGGHPEWGVSNILIGREREKQIFYDVDKKMVVGQIGTPEMFPNPEGDISLSPDGNWFVNGYKVERKEGNKNYYAFYRLSDGAFVRSVGIDKGSYLGAFA